MKKTRKLILPVLFLGTLTIMCALVFILPQRTYSECEKRILSSFPSFDIQKVTSGTFGKEIETYLCDHVPGRDFFVSINSYFSYLLGRNSIGEVYKAKDGYLIHAPKKDTENMFAGNMHNLEQFAKNNNIDATLMLIPSTGYMMADKLPMFSSEYNDDKAFETAYELTPSMAFFDTRQTLSDALSEGEDIYYRTDHHLTSSGSYALYRAYCSYKGLAFPLKKQYNIESHTNFYGTAYSSSGYRLTEPDNIEIWDLGLDVRVTIEEKNSKQYETMFFREHLKNADKYPVFLDGNHGYVRIENPHGAEGNLLIIRDSFAQNLAPFLSYNYKNIYMLDMRYYRNQMEEFLRANSIDEVLCVFGVDTLRTDKSTSWLLF